MPDAGSVACRLRGPYLPEGEAEWVCLTHGLDAARIAGVLGTPARRQEMTCPTCVTSPGGPTPDAEGDAHRPECGDFDCAECVCGWLVPEDAVDFEAAHRQHVSQVIATRATSPNESGA